MKKIKILSGTVCGGKSVKAGAVVDASDRDAHLLTGIKKAEYVDTAKQADKEIKKPKTRGVK